jgi:DNA-binding transcriptional MocR family regulator
MPTFQNPTGTVTSEPVRRALARVSEETRIPIVEDMALADLHLGPPPPRPIAAFGGEAPILTVGSLSKLVWGGLRVGWVRASEALIDRLARFKAVNDLGGPALSQAVAARVLPLVPQIREVRREELTRKLQALTSALSRHLPGWTYHRPGGGLLLWARLPHGDAGELAAAALRHGVAIVPGAINSPDGHFADHVRLPFIHDAAVLEDGVIRLAAAWREYGPSARDRRGSLGVII